MLMSFLEGREHFQSNKNYSKRDDYRFSFVAPCLLENGAVPKKVDTTLNMRTVERNFFDDYILMETLGTGSYSICKLARHKLSGLQVAVKVTDF